MKKKQAKKHRLKAERPAGTWTRSSGSAPVNQRCGAAALRARSCFRTDALLPMWGIGMACTVRVIESKYGFVGDCAILRRRRASGIRGSGCCCPRPTDVFVSLCCFDKTNVENSFRHHLDTHLLTIPSCLSSQDEVFCTTN